jgi:poly(beta-D-mannuronate) lyase
MTTGKRVRLGAAITCLAIASAAGSPATARGAGTLQSPFTARVVALLARPARGTRIETPCLPPSPAVHAIEGLRYYADAQGSVVDPALLAQNNARLKPLRDVLERVTSTVDEAIWYHPAAARCALKVLDAWAGADAMNGPVNRQGEYEREWILGGLALAYLKLRDTGLVAADDAARARIEVWLARRARDLQPYYEGPRPEQEENNHAYWAGLSVSAAGIAANDRALFEWGIAHYRRGVDMISADGTLPLELKRGARAAHYHLFALMPLVVLAELGEANGVEMYGYDGGALHRLAKLALREARDASYLEKLTGVTQDTAKGLRIDEIAWIEPYAARFGANPDAAAILAKYRPFAYARFGGTMTPFYDFPLTSSPAPVRPVSVRAR